MVWRSIIIVLKNIYEKKLYIPKRGNKRGFRYKRDTNKTQIKGEIREDLNSYIIKVLTI